MNPPGGADGPGSPVGLRSRRRVRPVEAASGVPPAAASDAGPTAFRLAVALTAAVYLVLAAALPPDVFWSPDEGAKLLQALSHRPAGPSSDALAYGGRRLDPELSFYPRLLHPSHPAALISILYPQPTAAGGVRNHWPAAFPLISLHPYRAFGARGLTLLPLVGGLAAVIVAGALGRSAVPTAAAPAALAVGLATPVLFYSQLFWEHSLAAALCLGGVLVLGAGPPFSALRLAAAGGTLGCAVLLRPESLLLVAVLPLAAACLWDRSQEHRRVPGFVWYLVTAVAIGLMVAASLLWMGGLPKAVASLTDTAVRGWQLATPVPERLAAAWFDLEAGLGPALPDAAVAVGTCGAIIALTAVVLREPARGWAFAVGGSLVLIPSLWVLVSTQPYRAIHALMLPAPFLCLVGLALRAPPVPGRRTTLFLGLISALYLTLGTLTAMAKMIGGLEWGNRYLLPLIALGAATTAVGAADYARRGAASRPRRAVVAVAVVSLVVGALYQARGARELIIAKRTLDAVRADIVEADGPTVTDLYWLPAAVAVTFAEHPIFTLRDRADLSRWLERIGRHGDRFLIVTQHQDQTRLAAWLDSVADPRLEVTGSRPLPGLLVAHVRVARGAK